MEREQALKLVEQHIKNENTIKHCLASEAVMKALAKHLEQPVETWGLAGLLHDLDVENTTPEQHGLVTAEILAGHNVNQEIIDAISHHNEIASKKERDGLFQHALAAGETITGMITATALVYPDKKLSSVKVKSIVKRMKDKRFAASVNRDKIKECEKIGIDLNKFAELSLEAMCQISNELGL